MTKFTVVNAICLIALTFGGHLAGAQTAARKVAAPTACRVCATATRLLSEVSADENGATDRATDFMSRFGLPGEKPLTYADVEALTRLASVLLEKTDAGDADEYFYNVVVSYKNFVETAKKKLAPAAQVQLQKRIDHEAKVWNNGNG